MLKYVDLWLYAHPRDAYTKNLGMVAFTHSFLNSLNQHLLTIKGVWHTVGTQNMFVNE